MRNTLLAGLLLVAAVAVGFVMGMWERMAGWLRYAMFALVMASWLALRWRVARARGR